MSLVRLWLIGTGVVLLAVSIWAFAPVLVFFGLLLVVLGLISLLMIKLAHALQAWRQRRDDEWR